MNKKCEKCGVGIPDDFVNLLCWDCYNKVVGISKPTQNESVESVPVFSAKQESVEFFTEAEIVPPKIDDGKLKIGIFTTFYKIDPGYSICNVVLQQLNLLLKYGYQPVLFVLTTFKDDDKVPSGVEVRKIIPQLILEPYGSGNLDNLDPDVDKTVVALETNMADIDVCLTHDIIFINSCLPYNIALRNAIDGALNKVKWLHWMHSAPSHRPTLDGSPWDNLYTLPKNSKLIYMNHTDVVRAAEMYGVFPKDVRTIFNPMDIRDLFNFNPLTRELIDAYDLMKPDLLCVYPLSTTRMDDNGKQLSKVIITMSQLKALGKTVALVVPNAHANAQKEKDAIEEMYKLAASKGLERRELIFTSLHDKPKWENGVYHDVVRDLFLLGNLFIFPSVSENCPLTLLEAMAGKNILILNKDFAPMADLPLEAAHYFKFGSLENKVDYVGGIDKYLSDVAKVIVSEFENNKVIKANTRLRQVFNIDAIAKNQLIPTIQEIYESK